MCSNIYDNLLYYKKNTHITYLHITLHFIYKHCFQYKEFQTLVHMK